MSDAHAAPEAPAGHKPLSKVEIAGFLLVVIIAQVVLAIMFIPKSTTTAATPAATDKDHGKDHGKEEKGKDDKKKGEHGDAHGAAGEKDAHGAAQEDYQEVNLGKFSLTSFDPHANTTLLIEFQLYGTTLVEHKEGAEAAEGGGHGGGHGAPKGGAASDEPDPNTKFGKLFKKHKHRFRDQIIKIIRNAEMSDLTDPSLALIKRQILAKTNALLGDPLLKEIVFSDFVVVEQ